ncbi:hypothetical protein CBM2592_A130092 [Cupriavidus taiwanensis]|nr:hypothetical protein CBM2588_A110093 [Cupriavidus taiwanensis]SOY44800.1 hypothetical protein CBM2592_A130092 [Cupriavidus taiwanensis]SOY80676.1 hypothetical protein CBM2591_A170055 [Cupriavidus taiwanensis]SOZ52420.1 hypothetical protein CBM2617_A150055 [Cupriavidus taiwanensis]SOZ77034.1 hypothetical protein CBM2622_A140094 [Cupriavidus taiwanensis]
MRTSAGVICVILGTDCGSSGSSGRCGSKRMPGASAHDASNGTIPRHMTALPNLKLLESFSTLDDSLVCKKTRMARRHPGVMHSGDPAGSAWHRGACPLVCTAAELNLAV